MERNDERLALGTDQRRIGRGLVAVQLHTSQLRVLCRVYDELVALVAEHPDREDLGREPTGDVTRRAGLRRNGAPGQGQGKDDKRN